MEYFRQDVTGGGKLNVLCKEHVQCCLCYNYKTHKIKAIKSVTLIQIKLVYGTIEMLTMERRNSLFVLFGGPEKGRLGRWVKDVQMSLTSESVQGASLPLESIDNIHGGDSLPLGVFGVGDGIPDDVLKENLEDSTGLLIDESRDTLDSSTTS